jgi:hypothetical protein
VKIGHLPSGCLRAVLSARKPLQSKK